jgi:lysozyme
MKINRKGIELIKHFEGCHLVAYRCPANVLTIGFGTTVYPDGSKVRAGDAISQARADELLEWDLSNRYEKHVRESVIYEKLKNDNEFSALVSFVYNVGRGGLHAPNSIDRRIKAGEDYKRVIETELPRWNRGGGRVLAGLVRRREAELELFFTPGAVQNIEIFFGETGGKVEQYQKDLNVWLQKWGKKELVTDGIFGSFSLAASNDFARNNKEAERTEGVSVPTYAKVKAFAGNQQEKPRYNQPDILTHLRGEDIQLSTNFHLREFTCKCGRCQNQLVSQKMIKLLQEMREIIGRPLFIRSAYRCYTHNRNVGGATRSRHLVGDAVDVVLLNEDEASSFIALARRVGFTGIGDGRNRGFIHVDLGHPRTWNY